MTATEKNNHYASLNERFALRSDALHGLGFKHVHVEEWDIGVWTCKVAWMKHPMNIPSSFVMNADDIVWGDRIEEALRYRHGFTRPVDLS